MQDKKTNVIVVNYSDGTTKQKKIKIGIWSAEEKQDFLSEISSHESFDGVCSFNVHHDKVLTHVPARGATKQFVPTHSQNKRNELIIEIIPNLENNECWVNTPESCPHCLQIGDCRSWAIKKLIGMKLFKEKYTNQK